MFYENEPWIKWNSNGNFDTPTGYFDDAEVCVCVLAGKYILSKLNSIFDKKIVGLYRDARLGDFWNLLGTKIERKRKEISLMFLRNHWSF